MKGFLLLLFLVCTYFCVFPQAPKGAVSVSKVTLDDRTLKFFLAISEIDSKYKRVSKERYAKIKDSFVNKVHNMIRVQEFKYRIDGYNHGASQDSSPYKFLNTYWANLPVNGFEKSEPIYYYTAFVSTELDWEKKRVPVVHVKGLNTIRSDDFFPKDSIGEYVERDFSKVDQYVASIGTYPLMELARKLTRPFPTELEKVRAIYKWITLNIDYDYEGLKNHSYSIVPEEVLKRKVTVCSGYAELFIRLCTYANLESMVLSGLAKKEDSWKGNEHAWNAVRIDGKWYLVDATWNSGDLYFLLSPNEFIIDHFPWGRKWTFLTNPPVSTDEVDSVYAFTQSRSYGKDVDKTLSACLRRMVSWGSHRNRRITTISISDSFGEAEYKGKSLDSLLAVVYRNRDKNIDSMYQVVYDREKKIKQENHIEKQMKKVMNREWDIMDTLTALVGNIVHGLETINDKISLIDLYEGGESRTFTGNSLDSLLLIAKENKSGNIEQLFRIVWENELRRIMEEAERERQPSPALKPEDSTKVNKPR